ncbi:hypothetical protein AcV5_005025 [Taiwanofungus camphoratus]|nr:hypothetical protein AcV5_005025 [Antrodia cinnamomea]
MQLHPRTRFVASHLPIPPSPHLYHLKSHSITIMGSVVSLIAGAIESVVSGIASIVMIIVSVIATIIITIFDIIFDIICCNWCGGRTARTGTHRYRWGRGGGGMGASY